jgi:hypothetical protein
LRVNTPGTGTQNTAVGAYSGYSNTGGVGNTDAGYQAGYLRTSGNYNTNLGTNAGRNNLTGASNTMVGYSAGYTVTSSNNAVFGFESAQQMTSGNSNAFFGYRAGYTMTGGSNNAFFGYQAGYATSGQFNTFLGANSGSSVTSGIGNTIVGTFNGNQNSLDIRTTNYNIVLSNGNGDIGAFWTSSLLGQLRTVMMERYYYTGSGAGGTITYYCNEQSVAAYVGNSTSNMTVNITAAAGVTLANQMNSSGSYGSSATVALIVSNGATAYYPTTIQVDGVTRTPRWQGGTAPTSGNVNSWDVYVFTVIQTSGSGFYVLASQTKFA